MEKGHGLGFSDFETELEDFEIKKLKKFDRAAKVTFGGSVVNRPLVHNGSVYFGACDHNIYAVDAKTGKNLWKLKTGGIIFEAGVIVYNNVLYIGNYEGYLYAISLEGEIKWKFKTGGEIVCAACADEGVIYFGSRDGYAYALDAKNGSLIWRFRTGEEVNSVPAISGNRLFIGSFDENLYCLDKKTGRELWRFKTGEEIYNANPFLIHDNFVVFSSFDSNCYCLNAETGKEIWRFKTGKFGNSASPEIHDGVLYVPSRDGILYAITLEGKEIWRFVTGENVGPPLIHDGKIYAGSCDNNFYALDVNGKEVWRFHSTNLFWSRSSIWKNRIYFGGWDCHLYCLNKDTGKKIWEFPTSTLVKSVMPPFQEMWGTEIKRSRSDEEIRESEKYEINVAGNLDSSYGAGSEYQIKFEYQQKMKY
jgi:outer membrane protein assembly factor BamB